MMILWHLFLSFATVGLFCIGGGYASMPLIQAEVVEKHAWLTMREFVDIFTISQMTPGPIGINAATFVGTKVAGIPGSIAATAGFVFPSLVIILILAYLYYKYGDVGAIRGILNGLRPAVVALIGSAGVGILLLALWDKENPPIVLADTNKIGCLIFILSLAAIHSKKLGTIQTLLASGVLGIVLYNVAKVI
jgi:chromate transporter